MIAIGIDPGVNTGYAAFDMTLGKLASVKTIKIHQAMQFVLEVRAAGMLHSVTFEDARLRKWYGAKGVEALQGAGSIKRDCGIWAEFLGDHGITYRAVAPQAGATKWGAEQFAKAFGWTGHTSEHARDAALLVVR